MKIVILAAFFAAVAAQSYPEPAYKTPESYPPQPYSFDWAVNDAPSYNNYGHSEKSDGNVVTGSYRVQLPDGRMQIVNYRADSNGYVADVKYEGEAKYPEYKAPASPAYQPPAPAAPAYRAPAAAPAYRAPTPTAAPAYRAPAPTAAPAYRAPAPTAAPAYKPIVPLAYRG
ncbi:cuticle protein 10.9-like [Daphnia pulex]|uniref:cuticle protein 10.9-like n=1 Tax=Daphnia pulex TaxID=6669 RepID=UPI001EDFB958|nr:cuticle protein 10.9-like [Daphnia pulex]